MNKELVFKNRKLIFRSLEENDVEKLYEFLIKLSPYTISKSFVDSDLGETSKSFCEDIGKYDKYRYVLIDEEDNIIALFEFSLDLPNSDIERYNRYENIPEIKKICRWGLTISDEYQNVGIGTAMFPIMKDIANDFNKEYIILYGGVYLTNERAIHYYKKLGFIELGVFKNDVNLDSMDMILKIS